MSESCKVCRREHKCATCGLRPADGGYHVCGQCRQRMREMYGDEWLILVEDDDPDEEPHSYNCICEDCVQNNPERVWEYGTDEDVEFWFGADEQAEERGGRG